MPCNKAHIGSLLEEERKGAEKEAGGIGDQSLGTRVAEEKGE